MVPGGAAARDELYRAAASGCSPAAHTFVPSAASPQRGRQEFGAADDDEAAIRASLGGEHADVAYREPVSLWLDATYPGASRAD